MLMLTFSHVPKRLSDTVRGHRSVVEDLEVDAKENIFFCVFFNQMVSLELIHRAWDGVNIKRIRGGQVRLENKLLDGWREWHIGRKIIRRHTAACDGDDINYHTNRNINTITQSPARCSSRCTNISAVHRPCCYHLMGDNDKKLCIKRKDKK